jgi:hypothetical protein
VGDYEIINGNESGKNGIIIKFKILSQNLTHKERAKVHKDPQDGRYVYRYMKAGLFVYEWVLDSDISSVPLMFCAYICWKLL